MSAKTIGFLLSVVGMLVASANGGLASPAGQERSSADQPKDVRKLVSPEQREALGLNDATWTKEAEKIHPDVYRALEKDERPWPRPVGFDGTAYVQVHLRHRQKGKADSAENKAAIKQLQSKVLSSLTAAEFHVEYPFQTMPGILGYVNRAGLEKLKASAAVVGVCLDDKPLPKRPPHVFKADLPALKPGDPSTPPGEGRFWGSGGKVEVEVYQALGLHERVFVMVNLIPTSSEAVRNTEIENTVLSALSADEFWLQSRTASFPSLHGLVSEGALKKLENHPNVAGVGMEDAMIPVPRDMKKRP